MEIWAIAGQWEAVLHMYKTYFLSQKRNESWGGNQNYGLLKEDISIINVALDASRELHAWDVAVDILSNMVDNYVKPNKRLFLCVDALKSDLSYSSPSLHDEQSKENESLLKSCPTSSPPLVRHRLQDRLAGVERRLREFASPSNITT